MTVDVRELLGRLNTCASTLTALGLALDAQVSGTVLAPEVRRPLDEVLAGLGLAQVLPELPRAALRPLLGEIRTTLLHGLDRLGRSGRAPGWTPPDPAMLEAAGEVSAGFPLLLARLLPHLPGLHLEAPGARFLDVGVGVGALAIEMARTFPALAVVGIDVWAPSLVLARAKVQAAALAPRIELREQAVQDLPDEQAFDLGWLPSLFIPGGVIPEACRRLHRALKPGGWALFAVLNPGGDAVAGALGRLRTAEWGGFPFTPAEAAGLLAQAGFSDVAPLPGPATAVTFVAGRRSP